MNSNRGLSIIDFLTMVLLVLVVAFVILPLFKPPTGPVSRVSCMNNVRQVGLAMIQYAGDHDDRFMPLVDESGNLVPAVDNEGLISLLPARSAFVVLLNEGYLTTTKVFICPSSKDRVNDSFPSDYKGETLANLVSALAETNCSYGWDPTKKHSVDATCAIIADKPSDAVSAANAGSWRNNSENHSGGEGQNVFYNDGHVKWGTRPKPDAGDDPDIYTGGPGYEKSPTDAKIIR